MDSVFPQVVFEIAGVPVRDTVISTWIMIVIVTVILLALGRLRPTALEMLLDFLADLVSDVMGRPAGRYLPLLASLAIFIAGSNVIGNIPIVTSPTRDINTPLALALIVFFSVHYFGIRSSGVIGYIKGMASPIFVFPLEVIGQLTRTLSLTLRLFGNILSTDLIVAVVFVLAPLFVPIPVAGFSIFTGILQAYIFTALAAVYIGAGLEATAPTQSGNEKEMTHG
ncbi:MAG: F0F1 ATP synthase subunit A [Chloroflexi bacterium]|nr:F0F1 ATP synthase subunit A [Chloroflexota bacterium]